MTESILVFSCGCSRIIDIPQEMDACMIKVTNLGKTEQYDIPCMRINANPSIFVEMRSTRPEWALEMHEFLPMDFRTLPGIDIKKVQAAFKSYEEFYERAVVPLCWIPDLMKGHGRFYGCYIDSVDKLGRRYGHLRVVGSEDAVEE